MRTSLVALLFLLTACKESSPTTASLPVDASCPIVDPLSTSINESPSGSFLIDFGSLAVGDCIAIQGDYAWVQDALDPNQYYAVNLTDGSLFEETYLVFDDIGCTNAVGTEFNYPLHLSGDVFVFAFEGAYYEYTMGGASDWLNPGTYYVKTSGGTCDPFLGDPAEVRASQLSAFARVFSGPLSL